MELGKLEGFGEKSEGYESNAILGRTNCGATITWQIYRLRGILLDSLGGILLNSFFTGQGVGLGLRSEVGVGRTAGGNHTCVGI